MPEICLVSFGVMVHLTTMIKKNFFVYHTSTTSSWWIVIKIVATVIAIPSMCSAKWLN
jgi:hypothetical protein